MVLIVPTRNYKIFNLYLGCFSPLSPVVPAMQIIVVVDSSLPYCHQSGVVDPVAKNVVFLLESVNLLPARSDEGA